MREAPLYTAFRGVEYIVAMILSIRTKRTFLSPARATLHANPQPKSLDTNIQDCTLITAAPNPHRG